MSGSFATNFGGLSAFRYQPVKFSKSELERLRAAKREIDSLQSRIGAVDDIKKQMALTAADYADGKITIREAAGLLAFAATSETRGALRKALIRPLREKVSEIMQSLHGIESTWLAGRVDQLRQACQTVEGRERADSEAVGIVSDDFEPSRTLHKLRNTHRMELDRLREAEGRHAASRDALNRIFAEIGI